MSPLLLGPIAELGSKLIARLFPDKEKQAAERAQAELALAQLQRDGTLKELGIQMSAILAEAQSSDPWTSRARPTFLYVMYILILAAIPFGVFFAFKPDAALQVAEGMKAWLSAIPSEMWWLFGAGYLGYTGARMFEKRSGKA
jgi:hypothetical protein